MAEKHDTPPTIKGKTYENYAKEIKIWARSTSVSPEDQASKIALSLPESKDDASVSIRGLVIDELDREEALYTDKAKMVSVVALLKFIESKMAKDDLAEALERYEHFESYRANSQQPISTYIREYDFRYEEMKKRTLHYHLSF